MIQTPKILIVDDEPRLCDSIKTLLDAQHYEVKTCCNGTEALHFLTRETFDLVLLDIYMEGMDGFQVIEKKARQKIDTPVIIITGKASTNTAVKALRMGAVDYLKKPFDPEAIDVAVKKVLNRKISDPSSKAADSREKILGDDTSKVVQIIDSDGGIICCNPAAHRYHQRRKWESLRRMAGSVAHHVNNQLGVVMGNLEMVLHDLPGDADHRHHLFQAMTAAGKTVSVGRHMLTYLGLTSDAKAGLDISELCSDTLATIRKAVPDGIMIQTDLPDSGPVIQADSRQIRQMLAHLITNALESISENQGTIELSVKKVWHEQVPSLPLMPIDWQQRQLFHVCVEISDTGCGINAGDIDRLFDPFFTTKFIGRGMGLPVVAGIVKAHGGCITVESEPDNGSVFRVFLPMTGQGPLLEQQQPSSCKETEKTGGTVLLIEPDPMTRRVTADMLTYLGHTVVEAGDGAEGIQMFEQLKNRICCVVLESVLPCMSGWALLGQLRKIQPDVPVILCSGSGKPEVMKNGCPDQPRVILHKPYPVTVLKSALQKAMATVSDLKMP
ncbi:MAG TPA: response regulator [Desulfotignum sp.]|nr:response regulator [Desulfotignum sp.]